MMTTCIGGTGVAPHNVTTPPIEETKRGRCKSRTGWLEGNHPRYQCTSAPIANVNAEPQDDSID
jgi:hypothetical protein